MIFVVLSYCILNRHSVDLSSAKNKKTIMIVGILGVIMVFVFRAVLTVRGSVFRNTICQEIDFNPNSLVAKFLPTVTNMGLSVFSYLGYGVYAIGVTITEIFMQSVPNAMAAMAPSGYEMLLKEPLSEVLRSTIEVEVRWVPDWVNFVEALGIPLFLLVIFALGWFAANIASFDIPKLLSNVICIFIFLQMLAIPIGNFVFTSTPNVLAAMFTLGCCVLIKIISWYYDTRIAKEQK